MSGTDTNIQTADPSGCPSIDAVKPSPYWLSPNVIMTTKPMDPSDIYPGVNTTSVVVSWKDDCAFAPPQAGLNTAVFDLYAGDPTVAMTPAVLDAIASAVPITISAGQANIPAPVPSWNAGGLPHLTQPHHACLLARVYPLGATPDTGDLAGYTAADPHYAQHNCTVDTTDGQGMFRIAIANGTSNREPKLVVLQAVPDLNPNKTVLDAVLPSLKLHPGFKQIATTPLRHVEFDLSAFKGHHQSLLDKIEDWIEKKVLELIEDLEGKCHKAQGITARVVLPPGLFAKFDFILDLSGAKPGDAHIYHVSQVSGNAPTAGTVPAAAAPGLEPAGGLTMAVLRI